MDIVIIGTGNVATILGKKLKAAGHRIVQIYGRNSQKASELAYILDTESTNYSSIIYKQADLYLVAVADRAIKEVLEELQLPARPIVHTAASVSKDILKLFTPHFGVFYPLQSLKKGVTDSPDIPIIIDASDAATRSLLKSVAQSIAINVVEADDEKRIKLHMAAVFCNNFVNHIYFLMERYCNEEELDFRLLIPLIQETSKRLDQSTPSQVQTGPAIRRDNTTIKKHLALLEMHSDLKEMYQLFTQSIQEYY